MYPTNLKSILRDQPPYRLKQAREAVFVNLIEDWQEATALPAALREELNEKCPLTIKAELRQSKKGDSLKALITLNDGLKIESVLLNHASGRHTVCLSSQVGCALGCFFCATGRMGFKRNLVAGEIIEQVLFFARWLKHNSRPAAGRINNLVFMGMGEPLLNYDEVMAAIKTINSQETFNIGARHISLSTIGIIAGIKKLAVEPTQLNLAVSLHAPTDELRAKIIPASQSAPLAEIIRAIDYYLEKTRRRVMIEYIMLRDINDSPACARQLAKLLKQIRPLYFVNLITYNPTAPLKPALPEKIKQFKQILTSQGVAAVERYRFGQDIKAACGQLASRPSQEKID